MDSIRRCSVVKCERPHDSGGLCGMHAQRRRRGKPLDYERPGRPELFARQVQEHPDGCWLWLGKIGRSGYGYFSSDSILAHRYAYELWADAIPAGMQLDHLCRRKACVNPAHLEVVTALENIRRMNVALNRGSAITACPQGHPYDDANTYNSPSGRRQCRKCSADRAAARRRNRKVHE